MPSGISLAMAGAGIEIVLEQPPDSIAVGSFVRDVVGAETFSVGGVVAVLAGGMRDPQ
jgi:hypothetical protein